MTDLSVPHDFTNNTVANATEVNANFDAVEAFVNTTGVLALQDGAVSTAAKLGASVVTTAKIADDAVTAAKVADGAIDATAKLGTGVVTTTNILDGTIANADISATAEIAVSKLADGAAYDVLQTNSDGTTVAWVSGLTVNHLADGAVTSAKILDGTIVNADINASAAIAYSKLNLSNSIVAGDITAGAITDAKVTSVTAAKVTIADAANDFTATDVEGALAELQTDIESIVAGGVSDGSITTAKLADDAVTEVKLADDSVSAAKLSIPGVAVMTSIVGAGSQTLTAGAGDTLLNNSASGTSYDTGTITVTNATARATVQRTGLYSVTGWASLDPASGTPTVVVYIKLNGTTLTTVWSEVVANASIKTVPTREVIMSLTAGDYLQLFGECATTNVVVEEAGFNVRYLGPAS